MDKSPERQGNSTASTIAQPSFASCRREHEASSRGRLLALVAALTQPDDRRRAAKELAAYAGAEELLILISDRELGLLLPAPGLPQTLPDAKRWRAFLDRCLEKSSHADELLFPTAGSSMSARGFAGDDGSVVVFFGGDLRLETAMDITLLLPLIASAFDGERIATVSHAATAVAA